MRVFQYVQFIIVSLVRISVQIQNNIADFFPPPPPVKIVPYRKQRSDEHDPCKHRDIPNIKRHVIFVFNYKYCRRDETSPADKIVDRYRLNDDIRLIIDLSSRDSTSNSSNLSSILRDVVPALGYSRRFQDLQGRIILGKIRGILGDPVGWTGIFINVVTGASIEFLFRIIIVPRGRSYVKIGVAWKYLFSMHSIFARPALNSLRSRNR